MNAPDLSIIIVAYGSPELLRAALASIEQYTHDITYEIIVVDNAPEASQIAALQHTFPTVQVVINPRNGGFAAGNNLGLRLSSGRYVALLNPDTLLHDDGLSALVRWLDAHPDVGAAGPRLIQPNGQTQPYSHGDAPRPRYLLRRLWSHLRGRYLHQWAGDEPQPVDWVAGTCMVVRRRAMEEVGPLDEQFFLYSEDVDWGLRLRRAGWRVMFLPSIAITHIGGGSVGPQTSQHYDRSLVRFYAKYYGGLIAASVWLALRGYRFAQHVINQLHRRRGVAG